VSGGITVNTQQLQQANSIHTPLQYTNSTASFLYVCYSNRIWNYEIVYYRR